MCAYWGEDIYQRFFSFIARGYVYSCRVGSGGVGTTPSEVWSSYNPFSILLFFCLRILGTHVPVSFPRHWDQYSNHSWPYGNQVPGHSTESRCCGAVPVRDDFNLESLASLSCQPFPCVFALWPVPTYYNWPLLPMLFCKDFHDFLVSYYQSIGYIIHNKYCSGKKAKNH